MRTLALLLLTTLSLTAQVVYDDGLFQAKSSPLLQGLQGYWRLEEGSGTRYDRSKNGNHLTANNSPGQAAGVSSATGNCATFTAASSQALSVTNAILTGTNRFTITAWAKATTLPAGGGCIVGKWSAATNSQYVVEYDGTSRFRMYVSTNGSSATVVKADNFGAPSTGVWYFIAAGWDGTNATISVNNGTANTTGVSQLFNGTDSLWIGARNLDTQRDEYWNGSIDEVGIWNRYLSAAEITQLYRSGGGVTHPQFHARALRDWRRWEPEYPTLTAWLNRKQEVIDL